VKRIKGYTGRSTSWLCSNTMGFNCVVKSTPGQRGAHWHNCRRWVERTQFAWTAQFRRLAQDYERPAETLAGLHF